MEKKTIIVEEVLEQVDGTKTIGNSFEIPFDEGLQRVRAGGWKVQGLSIGALPDVVAVVAVAGEEHGRD